MSRKLDALVEEKVMGLPVEWWENDDGSRDNDVLRYSTDPAAMMQVVKKIPMHFHHNGNGKWQARQISYDTDLTASPWLDTMMLAACWNALRAVGVSEDEIQEAMR